MIEWIFFLLLTWLVYSATIFLLLPILFNLDLKEHYVFDVIVNITDTAIYFNEINKRS